MVRYFMLNQDLQGIRKVAVNAWGYVQHAFCFLDKMEPVPVPVFDFDQGFCYEWKAQISGFSKSERFGKVLAEYGTRAGSQSSVYSKDMN